MKNNYRVQLIELLAQPRPKLDLEHRIEFKNCFGAIAGYADGRIFISCGKFGSALRLPYDSLEEVFKSPDAGHLKYFPNGHIKREYAVVPDRMILDKRYFSTLIDQSVDYVLGI
jgi:hypothetical protein